MKVRNFVRLKGFAVSALIFVIAGCQNPSGPQNPPDPNGENNNHTEGNYVIWQWDYGLHGVSGVSGISIPPNPGGAALNGVWGDGSTTPVPVGSIGAVTHDSTRGGIVIDSTSAAASALIIGTGGTSSSSSSASPAGVFDFYTGNTDGICIIVDAEILTPSTTDGRNLRVILNNNTGSSFNTPLGPDAAVIFNWLPAENSTPVRGEWDAASGRFQTATFMPDDFTRTYIYTLGQAFFQFGMSGGGGSGKVLVKSVRIERIVSDAAPPKEVVYYSEYGATGNGVSDDFDAIIATHAAANRMGAKVRADPDAKYYIGGAEKTVRIQTDTDWTGAEFIIDDSAVVKNGNAWRDSWVFDIESAQLMRPITSVQTLQKNQAKLNLSLPSSAVLVATDATTKRYIRRGGNQNDGTDQTDVFIVDNNGTVDQSAPIIWNFNTVTSLEAYPIDENVLTVTGGKFTTKANTGNTNAAYMKRGIRVTRSNTVIDGLTHLVTDEGAQSGAYQGFLRFENCANVTVKNTTLTGHKDYVYQGSYDMNANRTVNLSVINCRQTNDITDNTYWGVFTSNFSKNILFDNVKFSRMDAHQGVYNATIKNSELGWQAVSIIGSGLLTIENTKVSHRLYINLREDYGSTWEGDVIIRNGIFVPSYDQLPHARIIETNNDGEWNFGYPCSMPRTVTIEGFTVVDTSAPADYNGVLLVGAAASQGTLSPLALTETITVSGFVSSRPYRVSNRDYVTNGITIVTK